MPINIFISARGVQLIDEHPRCPQVELFVTPLGKSCDQVDAKDAQASDHCSLKTVPAFHVLFLKEDGSLLKDWSNIVHIKGVVNNIMSAVNQYNFPNSSPQYDNPYLSHPSQTFSSTSTDSTTEVELDDLEDGSAHSGVNHSPNGKRHCHTCGKTDQWHTPQDCPAAFRIEDNRMSIMGYLLLGSVFT